MVSSNLEQGIRNESICVDLRTTTYSAIAQRAQSLLNGPLLMYGSSNDRLNSQHYRAAANKTAIVLASTIIVISTYIMLNATAYRTTPRYLSIYILGLVTMILLDTSHDGSTHGELCTLITKIFYAFSASPLTVQIGLRLGNERAASLSTINLRAVICNILWILSLVGVNHRSIMGFRTIAAIAVTIVNVALSCDFDRRFLRQSAVLDLEKGPSPFSCHRSIREADCGGDLVVAPGRLHSWWFARKI